MQFRIHAVKDPYKYVGEKETRACENVWVTICLLINTTNLLSPMELFLVETDIMYLIAY
jgi:hypothetical protein